jgi:hypothetical protein
MRKRATRPKRQFCLENDKAAYASFSAAMVAASGRRKSPNAYRCRFCGMWHITKQGMKV